MEPISIDPITNEPLPRNFSQSTSVMHEFGKVKGLEILRFKDCELERTFGNTTRFASIGILQVLYFSNYDRFILSLNGWKYVLLRRMPIVAEWQSLSGPITFTLPTYNGFYTLRINRVPHIETLQNFETILLENSKFSYKGENKNLSRGLLSPDDKFRGEMEPLDEPEGNFQTSHLEPGKPYPLKRTDKVKRGFKMIAHKLTKGFKVKGKHNLNLYQVRDIESMKTTTEVMAPIHLFSKKEVERWIAFNKEVALKLGFEPETLLENEIGRGLPTFTQSQYMQGYGSMDLGQGTVDHPLPPYTTGTATGLGTTSTTQPEGHKPGLVEKIKDVITGHPHTGATTTTEEGYSHEGHAHPTIMDKIKSKLPGAHTTTSTTQTGTTQKQEGLNMNDPQTQPPTISENIQNTLRGYNDLPRNTRTEQRTEQPMSKNEINQHYYSHEQTHQG